jgi:hypothetical protein
MTAPHRLTGAQRKAMGVVQAAGYASLSNRTSAESHVIDTRVGHRLLALGLLERKGTDRWGRPLVRAAKGHR